MHHVHAHVQCKPALRAKQDGAPLRLWASELRRTSTTTTTDPRNRRRSRSIAAHNGDRIRRDTAAYAHQSLCPSPERNALTGGRRGDPRGDERCEAPPSIPRQLRPPADSPQPLSLRDVLSAAEARGTSCARLDLAGDENRKMDHGAGPSTDAPCRRTRDTATKSANTSSSRSASPRWTSSGRPRAVLAATERRVGPGDGREKSSPCTYAEGRRWKLGSVAGNTLRQTLDISGSRGPRVSPTRKHPR